MNYTGLANVELLTLTIKKKKLLTLLTPLGLTLFICFKNIHRLIREESLVVNSMVYIESLVPARKGNYRRIIVYTFLSGKNFHKLLIFQSMFLILNL